MQFIGCLLAFFLIIVWLIIGSVANIWRATFGTGNKRQTNNSRTQRQSGNTSRSNNQNSRQRRRKLFDDDEGEYVDFEEVK